MILTVTLNPSVDRLIYVPSLLVNDTNRIAKIEEDAGGKGINVARMLRRLGEPATAAGFVGGPSGSYVCHILEREGVECLFTHINGNTRTNLAIQEDDGSPPTALNEPGPPVSASDMQTLMTQMEQILPNYSYVCFGGSLPPGAPRDIYITLCKLVTEAGARVVLDADGEALARGITSRPFMAKPNEYEVERLLGRQVDTLEQAAEAAIELRAAGVEVPIVSMGGSGAAVASSEGVYTAVPPQVEAVSTVGSGDSMIAGFLSRISRGRTIAEALRTATAAGAATAMSDGSDIGKEADVRRLEPLVQVTRYA